MITTRPLRPTIYFPGGDAAAVRRTLAIWLSTGSVPVAHRVAEPDSPGKTPSWRIRSPRDRGALHHKRVVRERGTGPTDSQNVGNGEQSGSPLSFGQLCASLARSAALRLEEKAAA
jgi:hypothetical protein